MTEDDFSRIEQTLAIRLPDVYRHGLSPFPIPQNAGKSDTQVWDDAEKLIALNQRLRTEVEGWTSWLFVIGQAEGDPCGYAIDTRNPECPVWWLEQMRLGPHSGPTQGPFNDWFSQLVTELSPRGDVRKVMPLDIGGVGGIVSSRSGIVLGLGYLPTASEHPTARMGLTASIKDLVGRPRGQRDYL